MQPPSGFEIPPSDGSFASGIADPPAPEGPSSGMLLANRLAALAVLVFAVLIAYTSKGYGLVTDGQPGAGFFPFAIAVLLGVSAFTWLIFARSLSRRETGVLLGTSESEQGETYREGIVKAVATTVLSLVCIELMEFAGYVLTIWLYGAGLVSIAHARVRGTAIAGALVLALGSSYLFNVLGLALPSAQFTLPWS